MGHRMRGINGIQIGNKKTRCIYMQSKNVQIKTKHACNNDSIESMKSMATLNGLLTNNNTDAKYYTKVLLAPPQGEACLCRRFTHNNTVRSETFYAITAFHTEDKALL